MHKHFLVTLLFPTVLLWGCNDADTANNDDSVACTNGETQDGTTPCGLNKEGVLSQDCVKGAWVDNTDKCSGTHVCTNQKTQEGQTPCGFNGKGVLMQDCVNGQWVDNPGDCTVAAACLNSASYDESLGVCSCYPGYEGELCQTEGACNQGNKQKALYADFSYSPDAQENHIFDASTTITWTNIDQLADYGAKGIYEAIGIGTVGPGGYFGAQVKGSKPDMFLFSIWDKKGLYALPMHANCKRNCNDCSENKTTGTKCWLDYDMVQGDAFTMRIQQISKTGTAEWEGKTYTGGVWRVTAVPVGTDKEIVVGEILFQDTTTGLTRFNFFHEHIGCTLCSSFYVSVHRTFPVVALPKNTKITKAIGKHNCKSAADCSCDLYRVTGQDGVVNFETGPGAKPNFKMSETISLMP